MALNKQYFTVNGKVYATGLFWQPLQDKKNPMLQIGKIAKSIIPNPIYYCLKNFGVSQFGLAFVDRGHKDKMFVAAIALTSALKEKSSILSCINVDSGWWVCASRNGLILPEDDFFYDKEEDAKKHFLKLNEIPSWDYKIAPEQWTIPETSHVQIEELLEKSQLLRLSPLTQKTGSKTLFYVTILILIALFFYKDTVFRLFSTSEKPVVNKAMLEKYKAPVDEAPKDLSVPSSQNTEAKQEKVLLPTQEDLVQKIEPKKPTALYPYEKMNDIKEFSLICKNAVSFYSTPIYGWDLVEVDCDDKEIRVVYRRTAGDISIITKAFEKFVKPEIPDYTLSFDDEGETATSTIKQAEFTKVKSLPDQKEEMLKRQILALSQRTDTKFQTEYEEQDDGENNLHFAYLTFTFNSKLDIMEWANVFATQPAAEFTQIIWDNRSQTWKVKGRVYEKN